jgi:protein CsiD
MISIAVRERYHVALHPQHDRLHHIVLNEGYLRAFLHSVEDVRVQALECIPYMRFSLAQRLEDLIGSSFRKTLQSIVRNRNLGGFTIGVEDTTVQYDEYLKFATAVAHLMGPAGSDVSSGSYYTRLTSSVPTLHTDGIFADEPIDWLLMMKYEERSSMEGACRLLHLDDWRELSLYSRHALASKEFTYKTLLNGCKAVKRRTFYRGEDGSGICFMDRFVYPETLEQACYLKEMSDSLEHSAGTTIVPLPPGDMIVLNNYFWLHGSMELQRNADMSGDVMRQRGAFSA